MQQKNAVNNIQNFKNAATAINTLLDNYKSRAIVLHSISALSQLISTLLVLVTAYLFFLGWTGDFQFRTVIPVLIGGVLATVFITGLFIPVKNIFDREKMARSIGRIYPLHLSNLLSAAQLANIDEHSPFSISLVTLHLQKALAVLKDININTIVPFKKMVISSIVMLFCIGGVYLFAEYNRTLINAGFNIAFNNMSDSLTVQLSDSQIPVLNDLSAVIIYPEYLNLENKIIESLSGGIEAPPGAVVILKGIPVIKEASKGTITLSTGKKEVMNRESDGTLSGRFFVEDMDWFSINITKNNTFLNGPRRTMAVLEDAPPEIRVLRPLHSVDAGSEDEIFIEFEAADDHAINKIDLLIRTNDGIETLRTVFFGKQEKHIRSDYRWPVNSVKLDDVQSVKLTLRVYDNNTVTGPGYSNSKPVEVKIISLRNRSKKLIGLQKLILNGLVDLLGTRIENNVPVSYDKAPEITARFFKLRAMTNDVLGSLSTLNRQINLLNARHGLKETYQQIRKDLSNQILFEAGLNELPLGSYKKRSSVDTVTVRLLEKAISRVDNIILDQQFGEISLKGRLLDEQRESMVASLKIFNVKRSEYSRRSVLNALARMEKTAALLIERISKIKGQVLTDEMPGAMQSTINLKSIFTKIREELADGNINNAISQALRLDKIIKELMANLETGHLAFKTERFGPQEEFVESLLQRLGTIETSQQQIRNTTIGIKRQYTENLLLMMKHQIDPLIKSNIQYVTGIRRLIEKLYEHTQNKTGPKNIKEIADIRELAKRLEDTLKQGDLGRTLQMIKEIQNRVDYLNNTNEIKIKTRLKNIKKLADRLNSRIKDAFPAPGRIFNSKNKKVLKRQSFMQRHTSVKAKKLAAWILKKAQETSQLQFVSNQAHDVISSVAMDMQESVAALEKRHLDDAIRAQSKALSRLLMLRQNLNNGNRALMTESNNQSRSNHVFIPSPNDYQVPDKQRKDILKAMRHQIPEHYKEAVQKYYETLVQ